MTGWKTLLGLGICVVYIAVSLALVAWIWMHERAHFSWWRHGLIAIVCTQLLTQPIWGQLHPDPAYPFSLVPPLLVVWIVGGLKYFRYLRSRSPEIIHGMRRVWVDSPEGEPAAVSAAEVEVGVVS